MGVKKDGQTDGTDRVSVIELKAEPGAAIKSKKFSQKLTDKKWRILTLNPSKGKELCAPSLHFSRVSKAGSLVV
jgi:hypothetical protein